MCTYVCLYVCVAYLPLAALFISLFMTILVFMVSLPQLSDCRFYIYVVGWPARALQRHMVSLPYVCVCECMHVYETSCAWTFCFMVCLCCLFILLNSLVFIVFPSFVAAFIFFVYFFLHIIFYQTFVVVIKLWLLSNCLYWLEDFTWVLNKVLFLNELVFRNRKRITMSAVTLGWQIVIGQVLSKVSAVNDWNFQ